MSSITNNSLQNKDVYNANANDSVRTKTPLEKDQNKQEAKISNIVKSKLVELSMWAGISLMTTTTFGLTGLLVVLNLSLIGLPIHALVIGITFVAAWLTIQVALVVLAAIMIPRN